MFYRIITGDKPLSALIIIILALLLWIPDFIFPGKNSFLLSADSMPLYLFCYNAFEGNSGLSVSIAFLLVLLLGMLLNSINTKYMLVQQRTFLPALILIILAGYMPDTHNLSAPLFSSFFVVFMLDFLMRSYKAEPDSYNFFLAGITLGVGGLFYAPSIYFIVFIWISTAFLRPFFWREYIFSILGTIIPFLFQLTWMFLRDENIFIFFESFKKQIFAGFPEFTMQLPYRIYTLYLFILILLSSIYMIKVFQFRKIYARKFFQIMFALFISAIVIFIAFSGFNPGLYYLISIPVAFLLTNFFLNSRNNVINRILLYFSVAGAVLLMVLRLF